MYHSASARIVLRRIDPALAHRLFYPGVAAVLAARWGTTVAAMPVISYTSLSEKPPIFGVSCSKDSFTLRIVSASKAFSICLLEDKGVGSATRLASRKGRMGADKLMEAGFKHRKGIASGSPIIVGSAAALECSLQRKVRIGDHVLLVGRIMSARAAGDFRKYWRFRSYHPMLYAGWQGGMSLYHQISRRN
jgi:flavin reductase (DIM6/NTAB) family NADH-FMN oxidoreductase RutF